MLPIYGDRVLNTERGEVRLLNFRYPGEGDPNGQIQLDLGHYMLDQSCTHYIEFERTGQEEGETGEISPVPDAAPSRRGFRSWVRSLRRRRRAVESNNIAEPHDPNLYHYVALSYAWGPDIESERKDIFINGHLVKVRKNLHAALLQFRTMDKFKRGLNLWIDALSINQDHEQEKRAQILIMHKIYQQAGNIVVWLGPEVEQAFDEDGKPKFQDYELSLQADRVHRTISLLEEISQNHRSEDFEAMDECGDLRRAHQHRECAAISLQYALHQWKALLHENPDFFTTHIGIYEFFDRPYWRRLWIIQELAMGRAGMPIVCGGRVTKWRYIRDAAILLHSIMDIVAYQTIVELGEEETVDTGSHTASHVAGIAQLELLSHRKRLPWIDKTHFDFRSDPGIGSGDPIKGSTLDLALQLAMQADCFEPMDRVFGMLHIHGIPNAFREAALEAEAIGQNLWDAYGNTKSKNIPRPFGDTFVSGWDFNIENSRGSQYYQFLIARPRSNFALDSNNQYIVTGAPQCPIPEPNRNQMITKAKFDYLWIQFYNNPRCSGSSTFNYDDWKINIANTASAKAKLFIGVPASPIAATGDEHGEVYYLRPNKLADVVRQYWRDCSFGGIMMWSAGFASSNVNNTCNYAQQAKRILTTGQAC